MTTAQFAAPGSAGALADKIAWIDFGAGFQLIPGAAPIHVQNALPDGFTVEFDISVSNTSGTSDPIDAKIPPVFSSVPFGTTGYTGINGYAALYTGAPNGVKNESIAIRNIVVKNSNGQATTTFDWIASNSQVTEPLKTAPASYEAWSITTDGSPWVQIDNLPPPTDTATSPTMTGLEPDAAAVLAYRSGPVYLTAAPKNIVAATATAAQEVFAFGLCVTAREQAITDLIESVALEQTALFQILDAEGKKIQKAKALKLSAEQLLSINRSVKGMTDAVTQLEMVLHNKLEQVACDACGETFKQTTQLNEEE